MSVATTRQRPHVLWHNQVHRLRGEALCFWRLGFSPVYSREEAATLLHEVLHDHGICSAACYEMFGRHDLLLRVWLPAVGEAADFEDDLLKKLTRSNQDTCDLFHVVAPVRHWPFAREGRGVVRSPRPEAVHDLSAATIADAERGALSQVRLRQLADSALLADFRTGPETTDPDDPGTKFAVVVTGNESLTAGQQRFLRETIADVVDKADRISQRSLYAGTGFGQFLILGQLKDQPVYVLTEDIVDKIGSATNITNFYNARTLTHVSGQRDFIFIYESLTEVIPRVPPTSPRAGGVSNGNGSVPGPREAEHLPIPGEVFEERYLVEDEVGRGTFSTVYKVRDQKERNEVRALKLFRNADAYEHIQREISFLRKVNHPKVVRVFWVERTRGGTWYLVSEFVDGEPLERYARGGDRLTQDLAVDVVSELLLALAAIHPDEQRIAALKTGEMSPQEFAELQELQDAGFVHRDVKPSNVMLTPRGIKLLDFNIASSVGSPVNTQSGTPAYQAPDAAMLRAWDVSTDLFATGVVLYELLCDGEHPYPERKPRADLEPRDPRDVREDLSPALAEFLLKACAALQTDRFASAVEMREALKEAQSQARLDAAARASAFGVELGRMLREMSVTVDELQQRTNIDREHLMRLLDSRVSPTLIEAQRIAGALGVTLARLLDLEA